MAAAAIDADAAGSPADLFALVDTVAARSPAVLFAPECVVYSHELADGPVQVPHISLLPPEFRHVFSDWLLTFSATLFSSLLPRVFSSLLHYVDAVFARVKCHSQLQLRCAP